jgi:hypothetical protein
LEQLSFVEKVEADIKSSSFTLTFRANNAVSPAKLKAAVEDAGFFVGELQLMGTWNQEPVERGASFVWDQQVFQFISSKTPALSKSFTCTVVGKGYLTEKSLKKIKADYSEYYAANYCGLIFSAFFVYNVRTTNTARACY